MFNRISMGSNLGNIGMLKPVDIEKYWYENIDYSNQYFATYNLDF